MWSNCALEAMSMLKPVYAHLYFWSLRSFLIFSQLRQFLVRSSAVALNIQVLHDNRFLRITRFSDFPQVVQTLFSMRCFLSLLASARTFIAHGGHVVILLLFSKLSPQRIHKRLFFLFKAHWRALLESFLAHSIQDTLPGRAGALPQKIQMPDSFLAIRCLFESITPFIFTMVVFLRPRVPFKYLNIQDGSIRAKYAKCLTCKPFFFKYPRMSVFSINISYDVTNYYRSQQLNVS